MAITLARRSRDLAVFPIETPPSPLRFGTDGIRGRVNGELTPMVAFRLGRAVAVSLPRAGGRIAIAQDTRRSGDMLAAAIVAGATSMGVDVTRIGIAPTAALAHVAASWRYEAGIMVSASHNPASDNGLKVFDGTGVKLEQAREQELERLMAIADGMPGPGNHGMGVEQGAGDELARYREHRLAIARAMRSSLRVVVDCANGAASTLGPDILAASGATIIPIAAEPTGNNINEACGATAPANLADRVRTLGADLGIALDGDADRCVVVDERGFIVDGDALLGALALDRIARGRPGARTLIATEASNGGLEDAIGHVGGTLVRTPVGDRWVWEGMEHTGATLGGERSGHVILREHGTTGDGIVTALEVLALLARTGRPMSSVAADVPLRPQQERSIHVPDREAAVRDAALGQHIANARERLGRAGRILVRPSGTEPLVRIMVEGPDRDRVTAIADDLADLVRQRHPQR